MTAQAMAAGLLKGSPDAQATVLSGGSAQDVAAVVQVRSESPGKPTIKVTLSRLEGNIHNIWEVTEVQTDHIAITFPAEHASLSSPVTVTGNGNAFEGQVGFVSVLDHLYNEVGRVEAVGKNGMGPTPFTAQVAYHTTFREGTQEGLLTLFSYSAADGKINGAVILKVLLGVPSS